MSNEFYRYIARVLINDFAGKKDSLQPGDRYCLRLDNEDMVQSVHTALCEITSMDGIQGVYNYYDTDSGSSVYQTITIQLDPPKKEVVVASQIDGMKENFLATLRNVQRTRYNYPIIIITHSRIDTIINATGDLSAQGMPFHAESLYNVIQQHIKGNALRAEDKALLTNALTHLMENQYSDHSSLFEFKGLMTVISRGKAIREDYAEFQLLFDGALASVLPEKQKERLADNQKRYATLDRVFKYGNLREDLKAEYDDKFITRMIQIKSRNQEWHKEVTYDEVYNAVNKKEEQLSNPLAIDNDDIVVYSGSELEYTFEPDVLYWIRNDGVTPAGKRGKNILIFNPALKEIVSLRISCNIAVKADRVTSDNAETEVLHKKIIVHTKASDCVFAKVTISDAANKNKHTFKICVLNIAPGYLSGMRTSYSLTYKKNNSRLRAQVVTDQICVNPGKTVTRQMPLEDAGEYRCVFGETLLLNIDRESSQIDQDHIDFWLICGGVRIPMSLLDEFHRPVELTGLQAYKSKYVLKQSYEYIASSDNPYGKIMMKTSDYFAKEAFRNNLAMEYQLIQKGWLSARLIRGTECTLEEVPLQVPDKIYKAYVAFVNAMRDHRHIPSLTYYDESLRPLAYTYVDAVETCFSQIKEGETLSPDQNDILKIGTIYGDENDPFIANTSLHPLNVSYQLSLMRETVTDSIRGELMERLSTTNLIPYIRNNNKDVYHVAEQSHTPEWIYYTPNKSKRYNGARSFIPKLVCDKIKEYQAHFSFLFEEIGNRTFCINLINMGDCQEILKGIILYYQTVCKLTTPVESCMEFVVHIYDDRHHNNKFSILSDQKQLDEFLKSRFSTEAAILLMTILSRKVRYFFCSKPLSQYEYAHITFYEMDSNNHDSDSQADGLTTGISLNGLLSGIPSVLVEGWYKTGFGCKYAAESAITRLAKTYNALHRVANSGASYASGYCMSTEIQQGPQFLHDNIYASSNWVVFINPKVDLHFFRDKEENKNLLLIHYSDQYSSAAGYDAITVTRRSKQYEDVIYNYLRKKGVHAQSFQIRSIIDFFNAINGDWLLRLISTKKNFFADSNFSREKMSILSAVKVAMAYYAHPKIVWVPVSLEELLRVSGGTGLSSSSGLLSAKNLGFERGPTCDDLLLIGVEGPVNDIKVHFHPIEVKTGTNKNEVIRKGFMQAKRTHDQLLEALCPEQDYRNLEHKLIRNFVMQLLIVCCEKMELYDINPQTRWDLILHDYREALLNEQYRICTNLDTLIGEGTVISFKADQTIYRSEIQDGLCVLELPEQDAVKFMLLGIDEVEKDLESAFSTFLPRISVLYSGAYPESLMASEQSSENLAECELSDLEAREAALLVYSEDQDPIPSGREPDVLKKESMLTAITSPEAPRELSPHCGSSIESAGSEAATAELPENTVEGRSGKEAANGIRVLFGEDQKSGHPLFWYPNDTNQIMHTNTGIIGTMGTGKTQFTKSLVTQLYRERSANVGGGEIGILIFDYKGDYNSQKADFIAANNAKVYTLYNLPFNPLSLTKPRTPRPLLPAHIANTFVDTIARVYHIGPRQRSTLFACIEQAYHQKGILFEDESTWEREPPTFSTMYQTYANDEEIKKNDSLDASLNKIYRFQLFERDPAKTRLLYDLLNGVVVIDLSGFDSDLQNMVVAITLDLFYSQMQVFGHSKIEGHLRQVNKFILVDEADNLLRQGFPSIRKILKEGREYGVGTILSTQFLKHFVAKEDDFSTYIFTWIVHNVADLEPADIRFVFNTEARSPREQELFSEVKKLTKHHSFVQMGSSRQPYYIRDKAFWELAKELDLSNA